ncbi:hypothetical protein ACTVZO_18925 [Streptomyces sp. IBSNAI002]|uniref:hypothetical protein n=1 Tax=Streptomyces sp. IBSNAI002 TaxID=3457500 RepID=UPI003FD57F91
MSGRGEKFKQRATLCLVLAGIAAGVFFFVGSGSQKPTGWGAAYAFGAPAGVELPSRCGTETFVRGGSGSRGTAKCEGTRWTAGGVPRTGTLYAYADEIGKDGGGKLVFEGEARALGDRVYGEPESWEKALHLTTLGLAALAVLGLALSALAALFAPRGARPRRG